MKKIFTLLKAAFITLVIAGIVKKPDSIYKNNPKERNPHEGKQVKFVENPADSQNADGVCGHLEDMGDTTHTPTFYESVIKRTIDIILSFFGLILLSPVLLALSLWIVIEDPGPSSLPKREWAKTSNCSNSINSAA